METVRYLDTRGADTSRPTFTEVVVRGIAPGGGLYVPERLPRFELADIVQLAEMPYWQRAAWLFAMFGVDVPEDRIVELMPRAYGDQWSDPRVAPVEEVVPGAFMLELWHGPTSAFKDMALQCMPVFFSEAVSMGQEAGDLAEDFLVLVATSGDTGKAALEGFAGRDHTSVVVFFPADGVSEVQRLQMVTQAGGNVGVFGVRGNFDDCQSAVKAAFADEGFVNLLRDEHRLRLSSANSINWGRLLPQVAYYASAYSDMVAAGGVLAGEPIDVCVPTGNFGNILAAWYAREAGVPIGRLVCASNENNVLADFIGSGTYDISNRGFVTTPSPSMDILVSSNLERLLFHIAGAGQVAGWMSDLATKGRFRVDRDTFAAVRDVLSGDWVSNDDSLSTIARVWDGSGRLLDPHTAVAWEVAERMRGGDPMLVVSTAHWAKFGADVYRALRGIAAAEPLPAEAASLSGVGLLREVEAMAVGCSAVPAGLADLESRSARFGEVVDAGREGVEAAVLKWLAR